MINSVVLQGRLTHDPELKTIPNGTPVVSFNIAVQRSYTKNEERKTDFVDIVAWRQTAEFVCRYFRKGMSIGITGHIQTDTYTAKDGTSRKRFEVYADKVDFLESREKSSDVEYSPAADAKNEEFEVFVADDRFDLPF